MNVTSGSPNHASVRGSRVRKVFANIVAANILLIAASYVAADDRNPFFPGLFTVRISTPGGAWGYGVHLGDRTILTAAHIVDAEASSAEFHINDPHGKELGKAKIVRIGNREREDLVLLQLDAGGLASARDRSPGQVVVCGEDAVPGEELLVAFDNNAFRTHASHDFTTFWKGLERSTATEAYFSRGVSGSGVYSVQRACLVGIVSRSQTIGVNALPCFGNQKFDGAIDKACGVTIGTFFVSAEEIRNFLK